MSNMSMSSNVGRIVFAIPFGIFGLNHLIMGSKMAGMVPFPGGVFWIYLTGVAMLAACIGIITRKLMGAAAWGLVALLLIYILTLHLPGLMSGDEMRVQMGMISLLKDLGLIGGALMVAGMVPTEPKGA